MREEHRLSYGQSVSELIAQLAASAIDPDRLTRALEKLAAAWPPDLAPLTEVIASFPDGGIALAHLLSVSTAAADKLVHDPAALTWLARPEVVHADRGPGRMQGAYEALVREAQDEERAAGSRRFDPRFPALRRWKQREMLRIALREVAGRSTVEQTTLELTQLAQICLRVVVHDWMKEEIGKSVV